MIYKFSFLFLAIMSQIAFSQSIQDMQKLRAEYEKLKRQESMIGKENQKSELPLDRDSADPKTFNILPYVDFSETDTLKHGRHFFGYDF